MAASPFNPGVANNSDEQLKPIGAFRARGEHISAPRSAGKNPAFLPVLPLSYVPIII